MSRWSGVTRAGECQGKSNARAAAVPQQAMPQDIRGRRKALVIGCLLACCSSSAGGGRAFYIARSMPAARKHSGHCFHCISHNAAGKEIRVSGNPECIRPAIRTDAAIHRTIRRRTAGPASTREKSSTLTPASGSAGCIALSIVVSSSFCLLIVAIAIAVSTARCSARDGDPRRRAGDRSSRGASRSATAAAPTSCRSRRAAGCSPRRRACRSGRC